MERNFFCSFEINIRCFRCSVTFMLRKNLMLGLIHIFIWNILFGLEFFISYLTTRQPLNSAEKNWPNMEWKQVSIRRNAPEFTEKPLNWAVFGLCELSHCKHGELSRFAFTEKCERTLGAEAGRTLRGIQLLGEWCITRMFRCYATQNAKATSDNEWEFERIDCLCFFGFRVILWRCNPSLCDHKNKERSPQKEDKHQTFAKKKITTYSSSHITGTLKRQV